MGFVVCVLLALHIAGPLIKGYIKWSGYNCTSGQMRPCVINMTCLQKDPVLWESLKDHMRSLSHAACIYLGGILISYLLFIEPLFHTPQLAIPQHTSRLLIDWFQWIKAQLMFSLCENSLACLPAVCIDYSQMSTPVRPRHVRIISFIHSCRCTPTCVDRFALYNKAFNSHCNDSQNCIDL